MTRHHCTHQGDEIHAAFARRLRENEKAALDDACAAAERSEVRLPDSIEICGRYDRVDFKTHPSAGVPRGAHLMIPSSAPGSWFSHLDGYGEPLRAEMWYWTIRADIPYLPIDGEPFYRIISGPVSLFLPARD
jgi:hypothetical protein